MFAFFGTMPPVLNLHPPSTPSPHTQNEALLKMKTLSDIVKSGSQKMTVDDLKLCIRQESYLETLSDLLSPLNPSVVLAEIWSVPDTHIQNISQNMSHIDR